MQSNKANAPCKFGILGQDTVYMDGTILGTKTDSVNVYLCNKFNQQIALYNMFKSQKLIGLRDKNSLLLNLTLMRCFQSAVNCEHYRNRLQP